MSKLKSFILIIISVLAVAVIYLFTLYYPYIDKGLYWKDIVMLKGIEKYSLDPIEVWRNDGLMRLGLFYQINIEDPLYYGPGLNSKEFSQSVALLDSSQKELKTALGLSEDIYPIGYLNTVASVVSENQIFKEKPNMTNGMELIKKQRLANDLYRKYAVSIKSKLDRSEIPNELFIQAGAVTSKKIIIDDLTNIIKNSDQMEIDISMRERCLTLSSIYCQRKKINIVDNLNGNTLQNENIFPPRNTLSNNLEINSNKIFQINSPCWKKKPNSSETHLIYAIENNEVIIPQLADSRYFETVTVESYGEALHDAYEKLGTEWAVNYMDSSYNCNNLNYQASLSTLSGYYTKYATTPLLLTDVLDKLPKDIRESARKTEVEEKKLLSEKYPSDTTLAKITQGYAYIYNSLTEDLNESNKEIVDIMPSGFREELLQRINYSRERFAGYQKNINFISYRNLSHAQIARSNKKGRIEKDYTYFMRSSYGLTLTGFSPSVWRSEAPLQYITKDSTLYKGLIDNDEFVARFGEAFAETVDATTRTMAIKNIVK